jgi:hypothetical protein
MRQQVVGEKAEVLQPFIGTERRGGGWPAVVVCHQNIDRIGKRE